MKAVRHWMIAAAIAFAAPVLAQDAKTETAAPAATAAINKPAPDFTLKDVDGKDVKLADAKGKITVLVWGNADCPAFKRVATAKILTKTFDTIKDKNVAWYTIDSTHNATAENTKKFHTANSLPGAYLLDPTGATGKAYDAKTTPHVFVIDAKGTLAYMGALDDDPQGGKEKTRNYVIEAVDALAKGSTVATATTDPYGCTVKYKK
jgi:peroxiredoxin